MNSDKKAYYEMVIRNDEKITKGHFFVYKPIQSVDYKKDEIIYVPNPITRNNEKCIVTNISSSVDTKTNENGTMVWFEGI